MRRIYWVSSVLVVGAAAGVWSCAPSTGSHVMTAVLKSTSLGATSDGAVSVTLNNISGLVDSFFYPVTSSASCGLLWQANGQTGPIGVTGRTYQAFDFLLGTELGPTDAGTPCASGRTATIGLLAAYLDLDLTIGGTDKVIRVALSDYSPYRRGDLLIKQSSTYSWANSTGTTLTAASGTRPTTPAKISALASASPYVNREGTTTTFALLRVDSVDFSGDRSLIDLSRRVGKLTIDFATTEHGVAVTDDSTDAKILSTFSAPFLTAIATSSVEAQVDASAAN